MDISSRSRNLLLILLLIVGTVVASIGAVLVLINLDIIELDNNEVRVVTATFARAFVTPSDEYTVTAETATRSPSSTSTAITVTHTLTASATASSTWTATVSPSPTPVGGIATVPTTVVPSNTASLTATPTLTPTTEPPTATPTQSLNLEDITVAFERDQETITVGQVVTFTNTSSGLPENATGEWQVLDADEVIASSDDLESFSYSFQEGDTTYRVLLRIILSDMALETDMTVLVEPEPVMMSIEPVNDGELVAYVADLNGIILEVDTDQPPAEDIRLEIHLGASVGFVVPETATCERDPGQPLQIMLGETTRFRYCVLTAPADINQDELLLVNVFRDGRAARNIETGPIGVIALERESLLINVVQFATAVTEEWQVVEPWPCILTDANITLTAVQVSIVGSADTDRDRRYRAVLRSSASDLYIIDQGPTFDCVKRPVSTELFLETETEMRLFYPFERPTDLGEAVEVGSLEVRIGSQLETFAIEPPFVVATITNHTDFYARLSSAESRAKDFFIAPDRRVLIIGQFSEFYYVDGVEDLRSGGSDVAISGWIQIAQRNRFRMSGSEALIPTILMQE